MIGKKIDDKEALELKGFIIITLIKEKKLWKKTQFKVDDIFGDIKSKDNISQDQIKKT